MSTTRLLEGLKYLKKTHDILISEERELEKIVTRKVELEEENIILKKENEKLREELQQNK